MKIIEGEIIVVDNNSSDGSRAYFSDKFCNVKFIWNKTNEGFAKANNKALEMASGDYILFLNPDTIVPEDCFEKCISFIRDHKNSIALGIKMIDGSGNFLKESKRAFPSPATALYKVTGLSSLFPRSAIFSKYHLGHLDENQNHEVDVMAGAFMMIPKIIIDKTGGFDERFFMYGEDIDLSYRIQNAGYRNFYFAESYIVHFKGESTKKGSLNYVKVFYKAMSIFVHKHYGGSKAGIYNVLIQPAIFLRAGLAAVARFIRGKGLVFIDAAIMLMSFWFVKFFWNSFIESGVNYTSRLRLVAFPAFTGLFLIVSYFARLYDNGFKQSKLNKATIVAMLLNLAGYSLLPENLRFSRGTLLLGSLLSFGLMTLIRLLSLKWDLIESAVEKNERNETVVAGSEIQFQEVLALLSNDGMNERVVGRIGTVEHKQEKTMGEISELNSLLNQFPIREIIFCEGSLTYKKIIDCISQIPGRARFKIYTSCTKTLIGSERKNTSGTFLSKQ